METRLLSWDEFVAFRAKLKPSFIIGMLLAGDRISCCDEAVGVLEDSEIRGVATIAPRGEMESGQPTIEAVYVLPQYRQQGLGVPLLEATIRRCQQRGFVKIRIDAMSTGMLKTIAKTAPELRNKLEVVDYKGVMDIMLDGEQ